MGHRLLEGAPEPFWILNRMDFNGFGSRELIPTSPHKRETTRNMKRNENKVWDGEGGSSFHMAPTN